MILAEGYLETPIGILRLREDESGIAEVKVLTDISALPAVLPEEGRYIPRAKKELLEYFAGKRKTFDVPVSVKGTIFQEKVWASLREIPWGETRSYGEVAARIGNPKAARAVGMANNKNRILILIPCHRVIGADGSMTGFGCGIERKEFLLNLEKGDAHENG